MEEVGDVASSLLAIGGLVDSRPPLAGDGVEILGVIDQFNWMKDGGPQVQYGRSMKAKLKPKTTPIGLDTSWALLPFPLIASKFDTAFAEVGGVFGMKELEYGAEMKSHPVLPYERSTVSNLSASVLYKHRLDVVYGQYGNTSQLALGISVLARNYKTECSQHCCIVPPSVC